MGGDWKFEESRVRFSEWLWFSSLFVKLICLCCLALFTLTVGSKATVFHRIRKNNVESIDHTVMTIKIHLIWRQCWRHFEFTALVCENRFVLTQLEIFWEEACEQGTGYCLEWNAANMRRAGTSLNSFLKSS